MHNTEERSAELCAASSSHTSSSNPSCWGHFLGSPVVQRISLQNAASVSSDRGVSAPTSTKDLEGLALQRGCMAPSELLLPSRCTLLRRNWILVHSKLPAVGWNSKPTAPWALHRISLHGEWSESYTSETRHSSGSAQGTAAQGRGLSDALIAKRSHISGRFSAKQILGRSVEMGKLFLVWFQRVTGMYKL